jgi:hypothetical protein
MINLPLRGELNSMFGPGSTLHVDRLDYISSKKSHMVHVRLFITEVESGMEFYPDGLDVLIKKAWKILSQSGTIIIISSVDVK